MEELEEMSPSPCAKRKMNAPEANKIFSHNKKFFAHFQSIIKSTTTMHFVNTTGNNPILEAYILIAASFYFVTFAIASIEVATSFFSIVLPMIRKFFQILSNIFTASLRIAARLLLGIFTAIRMVLRTVGRFFYRRISHTSYQPKGLFFIGPILPNDHSFIGPIRPNDHSFIGPILPNDHSFIGPIRPNDHSFIGPIRPNDHSFIGPVHPNLIQHEDTEDLAQPDLIMLEEELEVEVVEEEEVVEDQRIVRITGGTYAGESCYIQEQLSVMVRIKLVGSGKVTCIMPSSLDIEAEQQQEVQAVQVPVPIQVEVPGLRRSPRLAAKRHQ